MKEYKGKERWNKGKQKNNRMKNGENKPGPKWVGPCFLVVFLLGFFKFLKLEVKDREGKW